MRVVEQRILRGPNLYAAAPCLLAVLDIGAHPATLPCLGPALVARLPALSPPLAATLAASERAHDALAPLVMALQSLAGAPAAFSAIVPGTRPEQVRAVCGYAIEQVVVAALHTAAALIKACASAADYDTDAALQDLRALAQRHAIGTSTGAVLEAAQRRGIPTLRLTETANLFQLGWGSRQRRLQATITGATKHIAVAIASDKQLTKTLLDQAGVPVPSGVTVTTLDAALRAARRLGRPVTIKPLDGNQGKGVTTACKTPDEIARAFAFAQSYGRRVIVEEFLHGRDYRVLVTGGAVAAASWRRPPYVVGDGVATVRALVERENSDPARGEGHTNILTKIPLDALALDVLASQGYDLDAVPAAGVAVALRGNANLSTGGTAEDVTDLLPEETRALCIRAARTIGLDVAGIDIVCGDIALPLREQAGGVIEVNAAPGIRMHQYPSLGTPRDAGGAIVAALFGNDAGSDAGRIPVIAVTGTNGKTTTSLIIAHAANLAGLHVGVATSAGVCIGTERILDGDHADARGARALLAAPDVDFAVLETAHAGILTGGLGFDACDVAVVLNIASDHLGVDGMDTLADLARLKAVVAGRARRAVVLNAEDDHCVAMASKLAREVEVLYFALDADNPALLAHLERGGRAAYLQDTMLVLAGGARHAALLDVRALPCGLLGAARHNVANALAAAAALAATGFGNAAITAGLLGFVSDAKTNPLRANVFDIDRVTVILDAAHNSAAYSALANTARALTPGRLVGVVSAPGDRRDADLVDIGITCAAGFDELVIYESANHGRASGEVAALLVRGVRAAKFEADRLQVEPQVHAAIRAGLARCVAGDVLVVGCALALSELTEAIRGKSPGVASRIEAGAV